MESVFFGPCSVKSVHNIVKKFKETLCTSDRPRSGRPRVSVEVVAEVHNTLTTYPLDASRNISHNLDVPKTAVLQILCSVLWMFLYRFQLVQVLEPGNN